jgi:hypothetical protein
MPRTHWPQARSIATSNRAPDTTSDAVLQVLGGRSQEERGHPPKSAENAESYESTGGARMVRRSVLVMAAVLVPALAPAAQAAHGTPKNCGHMIVDPRGNAVQWFLPTQPYNAEADLLYLDATTTRSTVDFTVTMASINPRPTTATDVIIYFTTSKQGHPGDWSADLTHAIDGTEYSLQNNTTNQVVKVTGSTDPKAGKYVIHVPRADIDATYRGAMLANLGVIVGQDVGVTAANAGFIEQSTGPDHHYRLDYPYGCL